MTMTIDTSGIAIMPLLGDRYAAERACDGAVAQREWTGPGSRCIPPRRTCHLRLNAWYRALFGEPDWMGGYFWFVEVKR